MPVPDNPQLPPSANGSADSTGYRQDLGDLTLQAFDLRSKHHYALHPVEAVIRYFRPEAEGLGQESNGRICFEEAETQYRAGAQGLRLSEIPQLPQQLRELSRLIAEGPSVAGS